MSKPTAAVRRIAEFWQNGLSGHFRRVINERQHPETAPFAAWRSNSTDADFPAIGFSHFADAAFSRKRGTRVVATKRVSPFQPFKSVVLGGTETVLSLHGVWTRKTRDKAVIGAKFPNDRL